MATMVSNYYLRKQFCDGTCRGCGTGYPEHCEGPAGSEEPTFHIECEHCRHAPAAHTLIDEVQTWWDVCLECSAYLRTLPEFMER